MFKTNDGTVSLASCAHVYANMAGNVPDVELQKWSARTKLISLRPNGLDRGRERLLLQSRLLFYTKTLATPDGSFKEAVYAHTLNGRRKGDPHWGVNICDPKGDWKAIHLDELRTVDTREPMERSTIVVVTSATHKVANRTDLHRTP